MGEESKKLNKEELLYMLVEMGKSIERLPTTAMFQPVTHADLYSLILILSDILRHE